VEAWSINRYVRPQLAGDVFILARDASLEITRNGHRRVIEVDDAEAAREIHNVLDGLRDPNSQEWLNIRAEVSSEPWQALVRHLDEWSLIEDAASIHATAAAASAEESRERCTSELLMNVESRVPADARSELSNEAARWLSLLTEDPSGALAWNDPGFYRSVGLIALGRLRKSNPPAFLAAVNALATLAGEGEDATHQLSGDACVTFYSVSAMRQHLSAIADLLVNSLNTNTARLCRPASARPLPLSGTAFQNDVEQALRTHAVQVGKSRFVDSLAGISSAQAPLAIGCHVEEFHVTRRFVEMITPLMHLDLSGPMRALVYRYFAEEVGHERFERDTCLACGVDETSLEASAPLPLHVAFVDVFTQLAVMDPVAFFAAVPITEGMLGENSPVNVRLDQLMPEDAVARRVYRRHEQLNIDLNHASIARLALQLVPAVSPQQQQRALNALALVFELNFRAWEALTDFYGDQLELRLPLPFDRDLPRNQDPMRLQ